MALRIGLTGGVGSGKSTVAGIFADLGAVIIDADAIAREVVEPGTPGLTAVVERFGRDVLAADGALDRPALASIVFGDEQQRQALNAIVHPLVGARMAELMAAAPADAVVVWDIPLLVENDSAAGFDVIVVVEADTDVRLSRLAARGMAERDARERMAAQASDEQRRAVADEVIVNNGGLDDLRQRVGEVWRTITQAAADGVGKLEPHPRIG
jgi:dephospho-CoA kinase